MQLTRRQLSVRSFDADEMMVDAETIDGAHLDETIRSLFANERSNTLHVHNAGPGCWATSIKKAS